MHKVLIVDDERIIREGIASVIPWENEGFRVAGAAQNGLEAYEMICADKPDIVITDIKMPALDGLGLIAKVKTVFPEILFIVISGYGEFELAKEAMRYGVRHYLLKPCNENKILEVLHEVKSELAQREQREEFIRRNRDSFEKVLPLVREQFLRDFISNRHGAQAELEYYSKLFGFQDDGVRVLLFQPEGDYGYEELFSLMNVLDGIFKEKRFLNTIIRNHVLVLAGAMDDQPLLDLIHQAQESYGFYQNRQLTVAYGDNAPIRNTPPVYNELQECLKYVFYLGEGSIISSKDIDHTGNADSQFNMMFDFDPIALAVKSGNPDAVEGEVGKVFDSLKETKCEVQIIKTYAMEILMIMLRQSNNEEIDKLIGNFLNIQNLKSLEQLHQFVSETGCRLAQVNYQKIITTHNKLVRKIISYIEDNYANEDLSLKWLSNRVVFMNDNYLSKLFFKETGQKFSHFLTKVRMEKAKELIAASELDRVWEVAEKVGLGNNPQYFSQLFKKYTGLSPSEYKKDLLSK